MGGGKTISENGGKIGNAVFIIEDNCEIQGQAIMADVGTDNIKDKCSFITPVPGGVGPMTITTLMENTLKACKMSLEK